MAKQLTAPGCKYSIVARVDTTIYSPDQKWVLDVPAGQTDFIAETNEIIIPADAMMCRKKCQIAADLARFNVLGRGAGSLATFVTRAIEQIVGKGNAKVEYGDGKLSVSLASSVTAAQVTEVESLLQRLLPKDVVLELDEIPMGYMRLDFLESTGTQYILAPWAAYDEIEYTSQLRNTTYDIHCPAGCSDSEGTGIYLTEYNPSGLYCRYGVNYYYSRPNANFPSYEVHEVKIKDFKLYLNNNLFANIQRSDFEFGNSDYIGVFVRFTKSKNAVDYVYQGAIYRVSIKSKDVNVYNFIPCLDDKGIPCMLDTVTRQTFRNQGTGQFIIGLTMAQALNLANLPVPTTSNTLTVSLPWDAQWDAVVQNALDRASVKGWTITVQYRDPEIATENIPVSFLESTGGQYIETDIITAVDDTFLLDCQNLPGNGGVARYIVTASKLASDASVQCSWTWGTYDSTYLFAYTWLGSAGGEVQANAVENTVGVNERMLVCLAQEELKINDKKITVSGLHTETVTKTRFLTFFSRWGKPDVVGRIFSLYRNNNKLSQQNALLPCLSPTGVPCMHDSVSGQNFYNAGTGAFIAGFDTAEQAGKLATLPDVTAETDETKKSLTVSIPLELAFDAGVKRALSIATARGWTITVQYRESEVATANLEADFLESTGTQYIDTGIKSTPTSKWEVDYQSKKTPGTVFESVFGGQTGTNKDRLTAIILTNNSATRFTAARNNYGGAVALLDQDIAFSDDFPVTARHIYGIDVRDGIAYVDDRTLKGNPDANTFTNYPVFVMARNTAGYVSNIAAGKLYGVRVSESGTLIQSQVPALAPDGTPCMHDTVSGQNFYNANTAEGSTPFIVGFDTTEKAAISLSKLPRITKAGTLTVSLPAEAEDTSTLVPAAIDIAKSRGWTIITQYRTN